MLYAFVALANVACGFHLRGAQGEGVLPEPLSRLRVVVQDSKFAYDPLLGVTRSVILSDPKATVTDDPGVPALILFGERTETQVLSVSESGRVNGYVLKYELGFRLLDGGSRQLLDPQTVRVIRDFTFDPLNVLAKEQEERELKRVMQRDAVRQIVQRLSRYRGQE